jgi:hypothetical protein
MRLLPKNEKPVMVSKVGGLKNSVDDLARYGAYSCANRVLPYFAYAWYTVSDSLPIVHSITTLVAPSDARLVSAGGH